MKMWSVQCGLIHECCAASVVLCCECCVVLRVLCCATNSVILRRNSYLCVLQTVVRVTFLMPRSKVKCLCTPW